MLCGSSNDQLPIKSGKSNNVLLEKNRGAGLVYHLSSFTSRYRGYQAPLLINLGKGQLCMICIIYIYIMYNIYIYIMYNIYIYILYLRSQYINPIKIFVSESSVSAHLNGLFPHPHCASLSFTSLAFRVSNSR